MDEPHTSAGNRAYESWNTAPYYLVDGDESDRENEGEREGNNEESDDGRSIDMQTKNKEK